MKTFRKPRSDSYEGHLTDEERKQLYAWLLQPGLSLKETVRRAPPWRGGPRDGQKPGAEAIGKISRRMRAETGLAELEATALVQHAALTAILKHVPPGDLHEEIVNLAMMLISQQVISGTLKNLDPASRNAAAGLMLKRSDQHLNQKKFELIMRKFEEGAKAAKEQAEREGLAGRRDGGIPPEVLGQIEKELKLL
jgi:hypothetical protein